AQRPDPLGERGQHGCRRGQGSVRRDADSRSAIGHRSRKRIGFWECAHDHRRSAGLRTTCILVLDPRRVKALSFISLDTLPPGFAFEASGAAMTQLLENHLGGRWQTGSGAGTPLFDPVLGTELVRISSAGLDLAGAFDYARQRGGAALRALTYAERAALLARVAETLQGHRDAYFDIALQNSGTTRNDSSVDIDGAIFTLGQYARWGAKLGDARWLADGAAVKLGKDGSFQTGHVLTPQRGLVLCINAFNFPAWGLWEKAAPALLSGVPVVVKPASATAWLTQRMVADVIAAGVLPDGALSIVCGSSEGLLDALQPFDLLSFTGSADTARAIREHHAVLRHGVRMNSETDSLNSALLAPDAAPGSDAFASMVREVVREMTIKSGQKCTAIRRVLVPQPIAREAADAIASAL